MINSEGEEAEIRISTFYNCCEKKDGLKCDAELYKRITLLLVKMQVPVNCSGYNYLRYAIYLSVKDTSFLNRNTTVIYKKTAEKYGTNISSVERCIRHALGTAYDRGGIQKINEFLKEEIFEHNSKLTNGEFINVLTNGLICEYNIIV